MSDYDNLKVFSGNSNIELSEKIVKKIRDAELSKRPFMLIVGEKEFNTQQVSVRQRGEGDKGAMSIEDFAAVVNNLVEKELVTND